MDGLFDFALQLARLQARMSRVSIDPPDDDPHSDPIVECSHCHKSFPWLFDDDVPADVLCGACYVEREDALFDDAIDDQRALARDRR